MKEYKFIIPNTSDIKVGNVVEINGVRHILTDDVKCRDCSLRNECDDLLIPFPCGYNSTAAFKIEKL